jgi:hypothetical protein
LKLRRTAFQFSPGSDGRTFILPFRFPLFRPTFSVHFHAQAIVLELDFCLQQALPLLLPQIEPIIEFMLNSTKSLHDEVALEACEFWQVMAGNELTQQTIMPRLSDVSASPIAVHEERKKKRQLRETTLGDVSHFSPTSPDLVHFT